VTSQTSISQISHEGDPYIRLFLREGVLNAGDSVIVRLQFANEEVASTSRYSFDLLSGQGNP